MGDTVPFKLTATLPSNVANYETYKLAFHDKLSDGLEFKESSVKVLMYSTKDAAEADVKLESPEKDVTANFQVKTNGLTDGCTFEVACNNVLGIKDVTKDTVFVVYYEATLDKDDAVVGAAGNSNEVYLEFSNDPYSDGTGKTEFDRVEVYTYKVVINKTDADNEPLKGAGFTLYKKGTDGNYVAIGNELKGADMTTFTWVGLDDGNYKLEETTVPAGYNKMNDIEFTISAEHSKTADDPALTKLEGGNLSTGEFHSTGVIEEAIVNKTGTVLPETGAQGTFFLICGGSILVVLAAVFMITRKKMSVFEE
ncbi:MAG: isopeptide-forming domain-containing fimbrial protein [Firmicutes bacterium]|nr:isopeptide-forming domain-containing fimbrial protein [Bacillota bacterium]